MMDVGLQGVGQQLGVKTHECKVCRTSDCRGVKATYRLHDYWVSRLITLVVTFSMFTEIGGKTFDESISACAIFCPAEIISHTSIPFFQRGLIHSGSTSRNDCGQAFPDELLVSSFP